MGGRLRPSRGERALADEKAPLSAPAHERDQLVSRHAAPGGKVLLHGDLRGAELEEPPRLERIDVLPDQQQEPIAAIEVAAVEREFWLEWMLVDGVHDGAPLSS